MGAFLYKGVFLRMLTNKVVVITGATSGLGKELALLIAKQGAKVIITGRDKKRLQQVLTQLELISAGHDGYVMDVQHDDSVNEVFDTILHKYDKIDILINNAGYGVFATIDQLDMVDYQTMINTNYLGLIRCTKAVLPVMKKQKAGHIVNIASLAGLIGNAKSTSYAATKHAVLGFTNSLRMELRGTGITVSAVNPGPIKTPFFDIADKEGTYVKNIDFMMLNPNKVAQKIIKLIHNKKAEINIPALSGAALKLYNLCPRFIDRWFGHLLNKK